jgi:hypothetical protein
MANEKTENLSLKNRCKNLINITFEILLIHQNISRYYLTNEFLIKNSIQMKNDSEIKLNELSAAISKAGNIRISTPLSLITSVWRFSFSSRLFWTLNVSKSTWLKHSLTHLLKKRMKSILLNLMTLMTAQNVSVVFIKRFMVFRRSLVFDFERYQRR